MAKQTEKFNSNGIKEAISDKTYIKLIKINETKYSPTTNKTHHLKWRGENYNAGIMTSAFSAESFQELVDRYLEHGTDIREMEIGDRLFIY